MDDSSKEKKSKRHKKLYHKNLNYEDDKNCLEATKLQDKIIYLEKNKVNADILKESLK